MARKKNINQCLVALIVALVASISLPSIASAARYGYTIPSGLPTSSPQAAANAAFDYAEQNSQYAGLIQREAGASGSFNRKDYEAVKFSNNASGTMTTATDQTNGNIVAMNGSETVKVVVVKNIKTNVSVKIMIKCGQVRVKFMRPVRTQRITRSRKVRVNKTVTVSKVVCPSGVAIPVNVKVTVKGWVKIKGKITVKSVAAQVTAYVDGKVDLKVKVEVTAKCPPPVTPPPSCEELKNCPSPPTVSVECKVGESRNSQGICVAIVVECKAGEIRNSAGVCVTQTNNAEQNCKAQGGTFNGATQLCTIIQINGNCSNIIVINGSGNTVSNNQEGNCNVNPPPTPTPETPKCPDGRPVPPEGCDRGPQVQVLKPAHLFVNGTTYGYAKAYDPDGDVLSVVIESTGAATAGGTYEYDKYYDGLTDSWSACPVNWKCFRAQLFAGSAAGTARLTATVSAGGKSSVSALSFPVEADKGWN